VPADVFQGVPTIYLHLINDLQKPYKYRWLDFAQDRGRPSYSDEYQIFRRGIVVE
jgi:hypothetical protein